VNEPAAHAAADPPAQAHPVRQRGFLGFVERAGNLLPEPTMIFVYLILVLMLLSAEKRLVAS
jgi:aminobenzoyl-glutamate transport protein